MLEKIEELKLSPEQAAEWEKYLTEYLGIEIILLEDIMNRRDEIKTSLNLPLQNKAEELSMELTNIAPHGNYEVLLEDNDSMANFLKTEAAQTERWKMDGMEPCRDNPALIKFNFINKAVDDGTTIKGFVFLSKKTGKIRHSFVQSEE